MATNHHQTAPSHNFQIFQQPHPGTPAHTAFQTTIQKTSKTAPTAPPLSSPSIQTLSTLSTKTDRNSPRTEKLITMNPLIEYIRSTTIKGACACDRCANATTTPQPKEPDNCNGHSNTPNHTANLVF